MHHRPAFLRQSPLILFIFLILLVLGFSIPAPLIGQSLPQDRFIYLPFITAPTTAMIPTEQTISYTEETETILNPERGFFDQTAVLWTDDLKFVLDMSEYRDRNLSILRLYFVIDEFVDAPIDAETLDIIDRNFGAAREAGLKIIPRFTYNFPNNDTCLLYTSPSPRDGLLSRMPSSA